MRQQRGRRRVRGVLLLLAVICAAGRADRAAANSLMDLSADGKLLACANRDSGTVTIIDVAGRTKLRELAVGKTPEGVAFLGDSHRLVVAVYGDDRLVLVDADAGTTAGSVGVYAEPYGVVTEPEPVSVEMNIPLPPGVTWDIAPISPARQRDHPNACPAHPGAGYAGMELVSEGTAGILPLGRADRKRSTLATSRASRSPRVGETLFPGRRRDSPAAVRAPLLTWGSVGARCPRQGRPGPIPDITV